MGHSRQHEMRLVVIHPSGAEEWFCPTCGRRFLMHWPPSYTKIVLTPGDEHAVHIGGRAKRCFEQPVCSPSATRAVATDELADPTEDLLRPWMSLLDQSSQVLLQP